MRKNKSLLLLTTAAIALSSCVDDNYNLSDMNTTVGISVNKLTIPLNVDSIVLDKVIDLEENSQIKNTIVNGKEIYAIIEEGTFKSKSINIPGFTAQSPEINPIKDKLNKSEITRNSKTRGLGRNGEQPLGIYPLSNISTSFNAKGKVDSSIKDINKINVDTEYKMKVDVNDDALMSKVDKINFEGFKAKLPKGLEGKIELITDNTIDISTLYDSSTGILNMSNENMTPELEEKLANNLTTEKGILEFSFTIDAIDVEKASDEIKFENGSFEFNGNIKVEEGDIAIYSNELKENITFDELPNTIDYVCTPELQEIIVEKLTGEIQYDIEGINIDPVKMNDIPDILGQEGTNIKLANPQIYLKLNNPLADQNIKAEANLEMVAKRKGNAADKAVSLDNGALIIDKTENVFCLTSDINITKEEMQEGYKNAQVELFSGLSDILSGNGLPKEIEIEVLNPQIPAQTIENFKLDQDIKPVEGTYLFFAPLALKDESSVIIYKDTLNDWNDETLEKLVISEAIVNANVKSEVPLELELKFSPIDVHGNIIKNVQTNTVNVLANTNEQPIEITIKGEIKNLDGIIISAILRGSNGESISPDHKISFKNLKVTVTGNYIDEL